MESRSRFLHTQYNAFFPVRIPVVTYEFVVSTIYRPPYCRIGSEEYYRSRRVLFKVYSIPLSRRNTMKEESQNETETADIDIDIEDCLVVDNGALDKAFQAQRVVGLEVCS